MQHRKISWRRAELAAFLDVSKRTLRRYMLRWQMEEAAAGRDVDLRPRILPGTVARRFLVAMGEDEAELSPDTMPAGTGEKSGRTPPAGRFHQ